MKPVRSYAFSEAIILSIALAVTPLARANAGLIIVSGDVNIGDALIDPDVVPGNQTFFRNILQGGTNVVILTTFNAGGFVVGKIDHFYNYNMTGVTSTVISPDTPITPEILAGVDLFISVLPFPGFTTNETAVFRDFVAGGGTIFFLGDNAFAFQVFPINDALAAMGSGMSIVLDCFACSGNPGYATGNQIAADPLTAGITNLRYIATSSVAGGTNLFFVTNNTPFVAYEATVSPPRLVIRRTQGSDVQISWRTNAAGFSLEFATNLPPLAWTPVTNIGVLNGSFVVTQNVSFQRQFFRLRKS